MRAEEFNNLVASYGNEVYCKQPEIDPENEHDWRSMALGYALGKGLCPENADEFASFVTSHRYIRHMEKGTSL